MRSVFCLSISILALFCLVFPGSASGAPFFDFYGFSYLSGAPFTVGTTVSIPMVFDPTQPEPVFGLDLDNNEYTVMVADLQIADVQTYGTVQVATFSGGQISILEDPARNSTWAVNPPNAQTPGTFLDGNPILLGSFTDCILVFDLGSLTGSVQGHVNFTGGARVHELPDPNQWLFFGGTTTSPQWDIPQGYDMAWDPQLLSPEVVPTRTTSWGRIRGMYR
jgi:hypothetical protein